MTEQEAIENFKGENKILSQYVESKFQKEVFAKKIERDNMAIKALEKQIAKKPIYSRLYATTPDMNCPVCNATLLTDEPNYCKRCGQKFNWGDEEE